MTDPWGNPLPEGVELEPTTPTPSAPAAWPSAPPPSPSAHDTRPGGDPSVNPAWPGRSTAPTSPPPPFGAPAPPVAGSNPPPPWGYGPPPQRTSGLAIASMVCGIVGMLCIGIILGPTALGLGIAARRSLTRDPSRKGSGMATAGIVLGIIATVLAIVSMVWILSNPDGLSDLFTTTTTTRLDDA